MLRDAATWLRSSLVARQFGWLVSAKVAQGISSLVAGVAVARSLGPQHYGVLSLAIAAASLVGVVASLGLEQIATREFVASGSPLRTLTLLRRLRLTGAILGSILLATAGWMPMFRDSGALPSMLVMALLPLAQVGDLAEWRLLAAGQGRRVAVMSACVALLAAIVRIWLASASASVTTFAWLLVVEFGVRSLGLTATARHLTTDRSGSIAGPSLNDALALLRESVPLLFAAVAVFVYMRLDQFMIAAMLNPSEVGIYSAVVTLAELPLVLPMLLLRSALPTLTRQSAGPPGQRDETLTVLMGTSFYLHLAVATLLSLIAGPLLTALYGAPYLHGASAFRMQVLASPFVAFGVLSSAWLVLERRTGHALRRTVIGAVANIGLNLFAIPRWGIAGAAAATLVAQIFATWLADALYSETRGLFIMKARALWPGCWRNG